MVSNNNIPLQQTPLPLTATNLSNHDSAIEAAPVDANFIVGQVQEERSQLYEQAFHGYKPSTQKTNEKFDAAEYVKSLPSKEVQSTATNMYRPRAPSNASKEHRFNSVSTFDEPNRWMVKQAFEVAKIRPGSFENIDVRRRAAEIATHMRVQHVESGDDGGAPLEVDPDDNDVELGDPKHRNAGQGVVGDEARVNRRTTFGKRRNEGSHMTSDKRPKTE